MKMNDDFRDLAPLDPARDAERWQRMAQGISRAAAGELARRREAAAPDLFLLLSGWLRPTLSAAVALAAIAGAVLVLGHSEPTPEPHPGVADALGYPTPVAVWMETDRAPSLEEVVHALEGDTR